jgi:hypothetical protein
MTPWLGPVESFGRPVSGDGGIISTVEDLATFSARSSTGTSWHRSSLQR